MTEYLTEQEQVELLKSWIKQYSLVILAGMALAFVAVSGWRYWQDRQARIMGHASSVYDEMLSMRAQNDAEATAMQAHKLFTHYPHTVYSQFAAFMLARDAVYEKNYADAEKQLQWVVDHSRVAALRQIARLRLARVLIAAAQPEKSLTILNKTDDKRFNGITAEIRGDAYLALHETAKARDAYQQALNDLPDAETSRPLLQMKYDNLATAEVAS